jgi:FAD/FMN-containing dehydrogenase
MDSSSTRDGLERTARDGHQELDDESWRAALCAVKTRLDPEHLLNPGRLYGFV